MSDSALTAYHNEKANCIQEDGPSHREICACLNDPDVQDSEECKELFDLSTRSEDERDAFMSMVNECIEHKDDPGFFLTICDCMRYDSSDPEKMEACLKKFSPRNLTSGDLAALREEYGECLDLWSLLYNGTICDCIKTFQREGFSEECEKLFEELTPQVEALPDDERERFLMELEGCISY